MKGKKLLCLVLSLAAVCSLMLIRDSAAWFNTDSGSPPTGTIRVDKMEFSFDGTLGSYLRYVSDSSSENYQKPYVVTEQNLIVTNGGKITVTNYSTIETEARFKITYSTPSNANRVYKAETTGSDPDSLSVTVGDNWIQKNNDGYFYYFQPPAEGESERTEGFAAVAADATEFTSDDAITQIMYLDELYVNGSDILKKNDYFTGTGPFSGTVHVIFEAKQADHVTWTQIASWATA